MRGDDCFIFFESAIQLINFIIILIIVAFPSVFNYLRGVIADIDIYFVDVGIDSGAFD